MSAPPLILDGSFGEGGGQILRSSLSLSLVTGQPFILENIRAGRKNPGLQRQHLTAVLAAAEIGDAETQGASLRSNWLSFHPRHIHAGEHEFEIGTAGSATLVLQTVLPALLMAEQASRLIITGGTHNIHAPPFEFLAKTYLPLLRQMGADVTLQLVRHGFYPAGGGRIIAEINPVARLARLDLLDVGPIKGRTVRAIVAKLPRHIAERECETIAQESGWGGENFEIQEIKDSFSSGNIVLIELEREKLTEVFTGFGRLGVRAESVAAEVWREVNRYLNAGVPVGEHLADQLLLPMGLSAALHGGGGDYRTLSLTEHSRTHIEVLKRFLAVQIDVEEPGPNQAVVRVSPAANA